MTDTATIASAFKAGLTATEVRRRYTPNTEASRLIELCERLGSPPAENLHRLALVEHELAKAKAGLEVAASGPQASARLVALLPVIVLLGAQLLGMRVLNSMSTFTILAMGAGALLLVIGRRWSAKILQKAKPDDTDPGAASDAFASALVAGLMPRAAIVEVEESYGSQPQLTLLVTEAAETGIALAELARAGADRLRLNWRADAEKRIQEASIRLMWPLGLAVLPAFVLIAIVPLAASMLRTS